MSRWRSIWLVARREILERGRSRGFILSILFTTLLVVGSFVLPAVLFGDEEATRIGVVQPAPAGLSTALTTTAAAPQLDREVEVVPFPDRAAADAALDGRSVVAVVAVPADLSGPGDHPLRQGARPVRDPARDGAVVGVAVQASLADARRRPGRLRRGAGAPAVDSARPPDRGGHTRFLFANIGTVLILIGIFSFGFTVLTGVVEEKQSRVVEVVLSTVRPRDLLMGKVLGIGILGLFQLAVSSWPHWSRRS